MEHKHTIKKIIKLKKKQKEEKNTENYKNNWKSNDKLKVSIYRSIITLNVNGLYDPIQRHMVVDWIKKQDTGFPGGAVVENLPANAGDTCSSPGLGRSHMPRSN